MAKKIKKHSEEEGGEAWLLPYSDLMTLLLAVFIVLFAVSKVDEAKAKEVAKAFHDGMMTESESVLPGGGSPLTELLPGKQSGDKHGGNGKDKTESNTAKEGTGSSQEGTGTTVEGTEKSQEGTSSSDVNSNITKEELEKFLGKYELEDLEELKTKLEVMFRKEDMGTEISTTIDKRGLIISLNNAILFESGSADIKNNNENTLSKIAQIINELNHHLRIEGHTDNIPINTSKYPSNWELSTARAASVVRLFINECKVSPDKVVAVGYGEYKPVADNSTEKGRAKNRRIDIIVLSEKYNNLERQLTK